MNPMERYPDLEKGNKISLACNKGPDWDNVFFESQSQQHIVIHDFVHEQYHEIDKSSIVEIYNYTKGVNIPLQQLKRNVPGSRQRFFEFINARHASNYDLLLKQWPQADKDKEYASAMYITALPMIFEKFQSTYQTFDSPVSWIAEYEYKFNDKTCEEYGLSAEEREKIVIDYDLTSSMVQLGRLALHLWTGYKYFHLLDCISTLDHNHYFAFTQAIEIRR